MPPPGPGAPNLLSGGALLMTESSIHPVKTQPSLPRGEGEAWPRHQPGKLSTQESGEVTGASLSTQGWRKEGDKH